VFSAPDGQWRSIACARLRVSTASRSLNDVDAISLIVVDCVLGAADVLICYAFLVISELRLRGRRVFSCWRRCGFLHYK